MACKRAQSALALAVLAALAAADSVSAGMTCYIGSYCSGQQLGSSVSVGTCTPSIFGVDGRVTCNGGRYDVTAYGSTGGYCSGGSVTIYSGASSGCNTAYMSGVGTVSCYFDGCGGGGAGGVSIGAIIGIVVAVILVVAIGVGVWFYLRKKRQQGNPPAAMALGGVGGDKDASYPPAGAYGGPAAGAPGAYGAPAGPGAYSAPPAGAYGAPPAGAYGAPPASTAYGEPPASSNDFYAAAPAPTAAPSGYGYYPPPAAAAPATYGAPAAPPGSYGKPASGNNDFYS